nr:tRNA-dihydrouridine synthase family protein [Desulfobacterales bacterium]
MRIGALTLAPGAVLAPLAGITNLPFRLLAREAGCVLVFSEMVSAEGLVHGSANSRALLRSLPAEQPLGVQLFGADPARMAAAAAMVESAGADLLDINFGCSVKKVVKTGAGAALMRDPARAAALLTSVRKAVRLPLTVKLRTGWERSGAQALAIGRLAQECGVDAVTIHPRTAAQKFSGRADWTVIAALKQALTIPVIGNGDIFCAGDAARMLTETGCDAVMVGRRAIGYPRIFTEIAGMLRGEPVPGALGKLFRGGGRLRPDAPAAGVVHEGAARRGRAAGVGAEHPLGGAGPRADRGVRARPMRGGYFIRTVPPAWTASQRSKRARAPVGVASDTTASPSFSPIARKRWPSLLVMTGPGAKTSSTFPAARP